MNKILKLSAVLLFFLVLWIQVMVSQAYAAGASLSLSPATGTFNKGCKFSVNIFVDTGGVQTDGTDVILIYDPSRLTAELVISGTIYPEYTGNSIDSQSGKILISGLSSLGSAYSGSGVFATVNFMVKEDAPTGATQVKFDFNPSDNAKTTDTNVVERTTVVDVLNSVVDGSYIIGTGSCISQRPGGGPSTPSATVYIPQPEITQPPTRLNNTADFATTAALAIAGTALISFGLIGIVIRR